MAGSSKEREKEVARAVRLRQKWIGAWRELGDAGAVCRRFGISRPTLRKWVRRHEAAGEAGLREESRPRHSPGAKVGHTEENLILSLRRERRHGRLRCRVEKHLAATRQARNLIAAWRGLSTGGTTISAEHDRLRHDQTRPGSAERWTQAPHILDISAALSY